MSPLLSSHDNHTRNILQVRVGHVVATTTIPSISVAMITVAIATGFLTRLRLGDSSQEVRG